MLVEEIKKEINKVLDHLPDKALEELLSFIKQFEKKEKSFFDQKSFQKVLMEESRLFKTLR